jgi:hypothetical protein
LFDDIFLALTDCSQRKLKLSLFWLCTVQIVTHKSEKLAGLIQKAIMESGTVLLQFDGTFGYERVSEVRAKALCNITDAQWTSANFAPLKQCLQNMTVQLFLDLDVVNELLSRSSNKKYNLIY